jgi:hypothetical protein
MDPVQTANAVINTIGKAIDYIKSNFTNHVSDNSITKLTKLTRAEPLTIISQDCANLEYLPSLLNNLCSIYSGYFLQAVSIMTNAAVNVEVVRILDALNPNRDSTGFLLQGRHATLTTDMGISAALVAENYKHSLPTPRINAMKEVAALEDAEMHRDTIKVIYEMENLAVGKLLNVDINVPLVDGTSTNGETCRTVTIPVTVRLSPAILNAESLTYLFAHRKEDTGFVERYHSWRAGRIDLIKDMFLCQDLINEYRRAALKDKTGTLQEIVRRVNANRGYGLLTKNPSMAISSNIYVISQDMAREIEGKIGYKFSDPRGREKIFEGTYAMIITVIDIEREMVSFYFNGIAQPATMSVRAIKMSSKTKGPDVGDIMKTLLEGRAPTF